MTNPAGELSFDERFRALSAAARAITSELALDRVLQRILEVARDLVKAQYAALGVADSRGRLVEFHTVGVSDSQRARIGSPPVGLGLLGVLIHEGKPVRVNDVQSDPRAYGFPPHHPAMRNMLGVPIISRGRVLGDLYLTNKQGAPAFTDEDEELIVLLASHAAVAIENAQLHLLLRDLAIVEERDRISRDLHDGIIQEIYAVGLSLEHALYVMDENPGEARNRVKQATAGLAEVMHNVRRFIMALQPESVADKSLGEALETLAQTIGAQGGVEIHCAIDALPDLPEQAKTHLIHAVREALTNAVKHANADRIVLRAGTLGDEVAIAVSDNGQGFDPKQARPRAQHGLRNLQSRAHAAGGKLTTTSVPGEGTTVRLSVPIPPSRSTDR
ncbi:MAG: GAF domain-containing sensor histidine kinase [Chloroflexi bacterium]|nr:GAF domain-containing sensor histidine kinase [Chloroflexota bacterium]